MTSLSAIELYRLADRVNVQFTTDDAPAKVVTRFVDASSWDKDPKAEAARVFTYLSTIPVIPPQVAPVNPQAVTVGAAEAAAKMAAMQVIPIK